MTNLSTLRNSVAPTMEGLNAKLTTDLPVQSVNDIEDAERRDEAAELLESVWTQTEELPKTLYEARDTTALVVCQAETLTLSERLHKLVSLFTGTDYAEAATPIARWAQELHKRTTEVPAG